MGSGAVSSGVWVISLGTSGTLFGVSDIPIWEPPGLAPFCDATGKWLPLLCTMNCTGVANEVHPASCVDCQKHCQIWRGSCSRCPAMSGATTALAPAVLMQMKEGVLISACGLVHCVNAIASRRCSWITGVSVLWDDPRATHRAGS